MTAEAEYSVNFSDKQKKFCLSLHYNAVNSYSFVNGIEICNFKAKDSEINAAPLCLGNVSRNFSTDNMEKTRLYGYVFDLSVEHDDIDVADILDSHNYLMKTRYILMFGFHWIIKRLHSRNF